MHASEQTREDVAAARAEWRSRQSDLAAEDVIFLDESGIDTAMIRRYARARGGQRAVGHAPAGHWRRLPYWALWGARGWWR